MNVEIFYMSGAGNLFTVIDNRKFNFNKNELSKLAVKLCNLEFKTEGLLAIDNSPSSDFSVLFYNPDGSSDMMCGNGGRCAIFFASEFDFFKNKEKIKFEMSGELYEGLITNNSISLYLPPPIDFIKNQTISINNKIIPYSYSNVGSKHIIINFESVFGEEKFSSENIKDLAKKIRYSEKFMPEGVNVNIYKIINDKIHLKTYEKGVEDITGACGTGAISTALHLKYNLNYPNEIIIIPPSEIPLEVKIIEHFDIINQIILSGHAEILNKININVEL